LIRDLNSGRDKRSEQKGAAQNSQGIETAGNSIHRIRQNSANAKDHDKYQRSKRTVPFHCNLLYVAGGSSPDGFSNSSVAHGLLQL
jgi:hypothetical protein